MANEWVPVELYGLNNGGQVRRYTIADGTAVSKGQLLSLIDPRTASASIATDTVFAGIAAEDHYANEGVTSVGVWTQGVFEAVASGAIALGLGITGGSVNQNQILQAANTSNGAQLIGYTLETAAVGETVNVRLDL